MPKAAIDSARHLKDAALKWFKDMVQGHIQINGHLAKATTVDPLLAQAHRG
jgi:hypothetical protein